MKIWGALTSATSLQRSSYRLPPRRPPFILPQYLVLSNDHQRIFLI